MKAVKWLLLAVALYELVVGVSEIAWVPLAASGPSSLSKITATIAGKPSVASVIDTQVAASFPSSAHYIEGSLDVGIAALIAAFCLR